MTKRSADVDLTEVSDSETEECVSAEDRAWGSPYQWIQMMTKIIIGVYQWWLKQTQKYPVPLSEWAETIKPDQLKFLLRRDAVMPALDSDHVRKLQQWWSTSTVTDRTEIPWDASVRPCWEPQDDYTRYFMNSRETEGWLEVELLAVAELRWLASGGILSMASNFNIRRDCSIRGIDCSLSEDEDEDEGEGARTRAARVDSIPPTTDESLALLHCLEVWNNHQLPDELGKRTGGATKQLPKELLSLLVEYAVSNCLQLVLTSTCEHLATWCSFGSTRRWWVCADDDMKDILNAFMYLSFQDFALTVTDTQGKVHDLAYDDCCVYAKELPVVNDREVHLQVQAKLAYEHICHKCRKPFRCIPLGGYTYQTRPPSDNSFGCLCHRFNDEWMCSTACFYNWLEEQ